MFLLGIPSIPQSNFATQLANGIEPREVYQNGQRIGRGIELTETVNGRKHFFSHAESATGITEVESWSDLENRPVSARYLVTAGKFWMTTSVEVDGKTVEMKRESSQEDLNKELTTTLPADKVSVLAQFDPLTLLPQTATVKELKVSIIDPEVMNVADATLAKSGATEGTVQARTFDLSTSAGSSRMVISELGKLETVQNSAGQVYKPALWNKDYVDMAARAGIKIDKGMLANFLTQSWAQTTQTTALPSPTRRRRG